MTRCGCTNYPICSCIIVGDGTTATVFGNGYAPSPFLVSVVGYPKPRPYGYVQKTTTLLTAGVDATISFTGGGGNLSQPQTMWNVATPTRLTFSTPGTYLLNSGTIHQCNTGDGWAGTDTGTRRAQIKIQKNGTTLLVSRHNNFSQFSASVGTGSFGVTTVVRFIAGDYIEMIVNLSVMVSSLTTPFVAETFLSARWMGL